jgi:pimeloyl-ACP methyl ester carboxylesterase
MATTPAFEEGIVSNGKIKLHYLAAGPMDGEPVLLLHGFPQFSYMWRHQLKILSEAGYRAVAPDLRGYNLSSRPSTLEAYKMKYLSGDVAAILTQFGWAKVNLVGHDWGGAIAWSFSLYNPARVKRLVAISAPHPGAFRVSFQEPDQLKRSWYIAFFQLPILPEFLGSAFPDQFVELFFSTAARKAAFNEEDRRIYREMLSSPGQLEAAINYYRANSNPFNDPLNPAFNPPPGAEDKGMDVNMPVALLYGTQDPFFSGTAWQQTGRYCKGYFKAFEMQATGHWIPEEAPLTTNRLILEHLKVEV